MQKETIDNEVGGVLNVVEACANTHSVTKLVLTSCLSTILWDRQYYLEETSVVLDEKNWTDLDFCRKKKVLCALKYTTIYGIFFYPQFYNLLLTCLVGHMIAAQITQSMELHMTSHYMHVS